MKKKFNYLLAFIVPLILMILLYMAVGVIGGTKNILTVDLQDQYIEFFNALKNIFDGKIGPFYSFSKTLGGNMFGLITYYLLSPFNLIIMFFNRLTMPQAILIINILKIATTGLTSYIYFNKTFKNNEKTSLMFSLIYALMAYNIVYSQNIMWLDGAILLPLIFLGIDKLIEKKPTLFYITLTLAIIFNYYIGYMLCIGSLIYFTYKNYLKEKKIDIKKTIYFIKILLLSVLTSSVILLPSVLSLLSGKAGDFLGQLVPNQKFPLFDIITRFYIGNFKNSDLLGKLPNIYISLITIPLIIYYFYNKKIDKKEKKATIILLSVFIASLSISTFNVIWHMFKHPIGFPFRYSFIFDFILLIIAYKSLLKIDKIEKEFINKFLLIGFIITIITDKFMYTGSMYYKTLGTFILLVIYLYYLKQRKTKSINTIILLLVTAEMFLNGFLILINIKYEDKNLYENFTNNYGCIIDNLNEKEDNFYRLEKDYSYSTNDEMLLNYNGISHFSSVYEEKNNKFLKNYFGIFNRFYITNYNGSTPVSNSLFNIKYLLTETEKSYYKQIDQYKDIIVYENNYNLPLGFMVNKELKNLELTKNEPFTNQNQLLKTMNNEIEDVFAKESYKVILNNLEVKENKTKKYTKINKDDKASLVFEITKKNDGILYAYLPTDNYKRVDIKVNGTSIIDINDENYYQGNILELSNIKQNEKVTLEVILLENELDLIDYMFYTLDLNKYEQAHNLLNEHEKLIIEDYKTEYIKAKVNVTKDNQVLYTSIPFDKGFKIYVNDKETKPIKLFDTLIGLELEKGENKIEFKYEQRGLKIGVVLSLAGIVLFIITKKND